jgi:hypothetical protein
MEESLEVDTVEQVYFETTQRGFSFLRLTGDGSPHSYQAKDFAGRNERKNANNRQSDKVGRGVPAEPSEHIRPLKCARMDLFHSGLNRGPTMLRLTRDGSPYLSKVSISS